MAPNAGFAPLPQPPPRQSGFPVWLIVVLAVLLFVVLIVGTLGVLAYGGFRRYIAASKTAEATASLALISMDAQNAFDADHELCASASHPVPASVAAVKGLKYASSSADWQADAPSHAGFACLGFEMSYPQYYQYDYQRSGSGTKSGDSFRAVARGDLNGDGVTSELSRGGKIAGAGVLLDPKVDQVNAGE